VKTRFVALVFALGGVARAAEDFPSLWTIKESWLAEGARERRHRRDMLEKRYGDQGHDVDFADPSAPPLNLDLRISVAGLRPELRAMELRLDELPPQRFEILSPAVMERVLWQSIVLRSAPRGGRQLRVSLFWREGSERRSASTVRPIFLDAGTDRRILAIALKSGREASDRRLEMEELTP